MAPCKNARSRENFGCRWTLKFVGSALDLDDGVSVRLATRAYARLLSRVAIVRWLVPASNSDFEIRSRNLDEPRFFLVRLPP